jgi:hypothetical protein
MYKVWVEVFFVHTDKELPHRYHVLLAQLAVGYEFLNFYRRDAGQASY